jgi:hypothetical protein
VQSADEVLNVVSQECGVSQSDIVGLSREVQFVRARRVAALVFRELGYSSPQTGRVLGDRDHTTVLHYLKTSVPEDVVQAKLCENLLASNNMYSVRWEMCGDGVRWFLKNPRTGVEMKLPVETGASMSLALSLGGVDA